MERRDPLRGTMTALPPRPPRPGTAASTGTAEPRRGGGPRVRDALLGPLLGSIRGCGLAMALAGTLATAPTPAAAAGAVVKTDQARTELLVHAPGGVAPGQPLWLGLKIEHQPHWHTYWRNPGDSGLPTTLQFELPPGFAAGEIAWPTPRALPVGPLVNFGYEGTLLLAVPVTVPADWRGSTLPVKLRADWLICKDVCIPEGGDYAIEVPASAASTAHAALFDQAAAAVPRAPEGLKGRAAVGPAALDVQVEGLPAAWSGRPVAFFPELPGVIDNAARIAARWDNGRWLATVPLSAQRSESPTAITVVLAPPDGGPGLRLPVTLEGRWPTPAEAAAARAAAPVAAAQPGGPAPLPEGGAGQGSLWGALLLALAGGLLLNLMPCVFPVLSLKVLGVASQPLARGTRLASGLAYTAGVVLGFVGLAALLLALRAGGEQIGWGFQLQSPLFVAALAALFALIALNLMGVFEVGLLLPGRWAAAQARHPLADQALTGLLAVAIASPCTAPFMGAALGLAATLPPVPALSVFAALGLGMALPYLALVAWPGLARRLPRPGPWMQHLRSLMAFPMWATVIWLVWVLAQQVGVDGVAAVLGVVLMLALVAWALGVQGLSDRARWLWRGLALALLGVTLAWAWPALQAPAPAAVRSASTSDGRAAWLPWSTERVEAALRQGQPVFVDFTAAWCVTCQFNKRTVLTTPAVEALFADKRVVLMRADWTQRDAAISAELQRLGRQGVPVYALHVPGANAPALLSEILSEREIREALRNLP
jgi:thiol:disulfide interchange protein DsbD